MKKKKWIFGGIFLFLLSCVGMFLIFVHPKNDREWVFGQDRIPFAEISEGTIPLHNIRDNTPSSQKLFFDKSYQLNELESVDFLISGFSEYEGIAHTFLSFGFKNGEHLAISVEARREKDEEYSPFWGTFRKFELIFVVGTERDLIGARIQERKERVYLYQSTFSAETAQKIFLNILAKINQLREHPEFYNTFFNNCTTNITDRIEGISGIHIPYTYHLFLPGYFDQLLFVQNLIRTDIPFAELREKARIDQKAKDISRDDPEFSQRIRALGEFQKN